MIGFGEGLARRGAVAYARLIDELFDAADHRQEPADRRRFGRRCARSSRAARAAAGRGDLGCRHRALGHRRQSGRPADPQAARRRGATRVPAYASSINWLDDATVEPEVAAALAAGFNEIKVKIGQPLAAAIERARFVRRLAGDEIGLCVDANWAYDVEDALSGSAGRSPISTTSGSRSRSAPRTAAAIDAAPAAADPALPPARATLRLRGPRAQDRSVGLIQPDVTRSGGITETWRIAELAASFNVAYAPHVGWSGAICVAASLQLAAAAESCTPSSAWSTPIRCGIRSRIPWSAKAGSSSMGSSWCRRGRGSESR